MGGQDKFGQVRWMGAGVWGLAPSQVMKGQTLWGWERGSGGETPSQGMRARLLGWPVRKKKVFRKNVIRTKIFVHLYGLFFVRMFFQNSGFFRKNGIRKKAKNKKSSKEQNSKEKNEFRKNVIRSNDLVPVGKIERKKICPSFKEATILHVLHSRVFSKL